MDKVIPPKMGGEKTVPPKKVPAMVIAAAAPQVDAVKRKAPLPKREDQFVKLWVRVIDRKSGEVRYPHRLNMTIDDVRQDLSATIVEFRRGWIGAKRREPDTALVRHAINWRVKKLNRFTRTKFRTQMDRSVEFDVVHQAEDRVVSLPMADLGLLTSAADHLDRCESHEHEEACRRAVYMLRERLPEKHTALLWLRFGEQMDECEIADFVGCDKRAIKVRLDEATKAAQAFLSTLGIFSVRAVVEPPWGWGAG